MKAPPADERTAKLLCRHDQRKCSVEQESQIPLLPRLASGGQKRTKLFLSMSSWMKASLTEPAKGSSPRCRERSNGAAAMPPGCSTQGGKPRGRESGRRSQSFTSQSASLLAKQERSEGTSPESSPAPKRAIRTVDSDVFMDGHSSNAPVHKTRAPAAEASASEAADS